MEQKRGRSTSTSPKLEPDPVISKGDFFNQITVNRWDRFALDFFILNTLHQLEDSDRCCCYCSKKTLFWKKIKSKSICHRLPSHCQICVIPKLSYDFESFVDNHRFNIQALRKYYYHLQEKLIKCFYDSPRSTESFLEGEHYFGGRDWRTGEYWGGSLSESIRYSDSPFYLKSGIKKQKYGLF